jgi:hypothetical protein
LKICIAIGKKKVNSESRHFVALNMFQPPCFSCRRYGSLVP